MVHFIMNNLQSKLLDLFLRSILNDFLVDVDDTNFNIICTYKDTILYNHLKFLKFRIKKIKSFLELSRHDRSNRKSLVGINLKRFFWLIKSPDYKSLDNYLSLYNLNVYIFHGLITIPYGYVPIIP